MNIACWGCLSGVGFQWMEIEEMLDSCAGNGYRVRDLLHALVPGRIFLGLSGGELR